MRSLIISAFIILVYGTSLFAQIRLDSIIAIEPESGQIADRTIFKYYGNQLDTVYDLYDHSIAFEYNNDGSFANWDYLDYPYQIGPRFVYNDQGLLDSIIVLHTKFEIRINETVFNYDENNLLSSEQEFRTEDQITELIREKIYYHNSNNKIDSVLINYYSEGELVLQFGEKRSYDAVTDDLVRVRQDHIGGNVDLVFNWYYEVDQLESFSYRDYSEDPLGKIRDTCNYTYLSTIPFTEIISPRDYYILRNQFLGYNPMESEAPIMTSLQIDTIEQLIQNYFIKNHTYYYSIPVETEETRIPMTAIRVTPNPTSQYLTIDNQKEINSYLILSTSGQVIESNSSKESVIDVTFLAPGHYTIIIDFADGKHSFSRFIKQ